MLKLMCVLVCAVGAAACGNPTEIVLFVDTKLGVPCDIDKLEVVVEGTATVRKTIPLDASSIASWTIVKGGGGNNVKVRALATKDGTLVAQGSLSANFKFYTTQSAHLLLTKECTPTSPCDFSKTVGAFAEPDPAVRRVCEPPPEPIAVEVVRSYTFADNTGLLDIVDACNNSGQAAYQEFTGLSGADAEVTDAEIVTAIADDFAFKFYNTALTSLWVTDDGYATFGADAANATLDDVSNVEGLTSVGHFQFGVAAFWENLKPSATGKVCAAMINGARNTLWITWKNFCFDTGPGACPTADHVDFSIGLEEDTSIVKVGFTRVESVSQADRAKGGQAVVGIIGPDVPACNATECSSSGFCADGTTPCGFTQVFSHTQQSGTWPSIFVFTPVVETIFVDPITGEPI